MKQKLQLQIHEPCHESWNNMDATQQGRFCGSCRKEVIDFSVMTDNEILQYISTAHSSICGRMGNDQLNRNLVAPPEPRKIWWKYWMGLAASFILLTSRSNAQPGVKQPVVSRPYKNKINIPAVITMGAVAMVEKNNKVNAAIRGKVVDKQNKPVPYASIRLNDSYTGIAADSAGNFVLQTSVDPAGIALTISSAGYQLKSIEIKEAELQSATAKDNMLSINAGNIVLAELTMPEVIIEGGITQGLTRIAGGISVCRRTTLYEKAKSRVKESLGTNEIKLYPNPIALKGRFTVVINVKDPGEYAVQFADVSGRIIYGKQLNIPSKNYTESFDGSIFPGTGIYFVHLTAKQNGKNYSNKLLVQY